MSAWDSGDTDSEMLIFSFEMSTLTTVPFSLMKQAFPFLPAEAVILFCSDFDEPARPKTIPFDDV